MRHLLGVVLAIIMAAAVFFVASWGYAKLLAGRPSQAALADGGGSLLHNRDVLNGFGALLGVGLLAGLLIAVPRISPLAAGLPGLVLLAWTGLYLSSVRHAIRYIPLKDRPYGAGFEDLLLDGVLALAGLAMVIPLFVPSRWLRRSAAGLAPPVSQTYDSTLVGGPQDFDDTQTMPHEGGLLSDWGPTRPQPRIDGRSQAPWGPADPVD